MSSKANDNSASETDIMIDIDQEHKTELVTNNESHPESSNKSIKWSWFDRCILYFPMCASLKPLKTNKTKLIKRNKYLIGFIIIISILLSFLLFYNAIDNFFDADIYYYFLNDLILQICQITFKLFSLHYFYSFKFPWYIDIKWSHIVDCKQNDELKQKIWLQRMVKIIIILMSLAYIPYIVLKAYYGHIDISIAKENAFLSVIKNIIFGYFWWYPITFTFSVHTALCIKYQYYLSQIVNSVKSTTKHSLNEILDDYQSLYNLFKTDYTSSLKGALNSVLLGTILYFWGFIYNFQIKNELQIGDEYAIISGLYGILSSLLMIIMYTISASVLNEEYKKLENELWNIRDNWGYSMYFKNYINKYYIGIKIGKFIVSYKTVLSFFVVFAITKYITFTVKFQAASAP